MRNVRIIQFPNPTPAIVRTRIFSLHEISAVKKSGREIKNAMVKKNCITPYEYSSKKSICGRYLMNFQKDAPFSVCSFHGLSVSEVL